MTSRKFAILSDNTVAISLTLDENDPRGAAMIAGLETGVTFVEVPYDSLADIGWTYDGISVKEPV